MPVGRADGDEFAHAVGNHFIEGLPEVALVDHREVARDTILEEGDIRRRALGHLLGHVLVVLDDAQACYPRTIPDHHVADVVAEEMVLPTIMVAEQAKKWFNDYRYLSRLFGVSEPVMLERMREMGIIKMRGVVWDY